LPEADIPFSIEEYGREALEFWGYVRYECKSGCGDIRDFWIVMVMRGQLWRVFYNEWRFFENEELRDLPQLFIAV
jgi:hypothetical protein